MSSDAKEILDGIDPEKIKVDEQGRVIVTDPKARKALSKIATEDQQEIADVNAYKCKCGTQLA